MGRNSKLGSRRTERYLVGDVNVAAIPELPGPFDSLGVDRLQIGGMATKTFVVLPRVLEFDRARQHAYIAKCPMKHGPRESATEYLISCIGRLLPLRVAEGRLVRMPPPPNVTCDVRFLSRYFLPKHTQELLHGFELIASFFDVDADQLRKEVPPSRRERDVFTVELIAAVLDHVAGEDSQLRLRLRAAFARMMAFDALVGANDRHPRNWGVIRDVLALDSSVCFSPVFDTSRGLFWNHSDSELRGYYERGELQAFVERYANGSQPLICGDRASVPPASKRPNHFDVIAQMMQMADSGFQRPIRHVIGAFHMPTVRRLLHCRFGRLFSRMRLEYIDALLAYRHTRLKYICGLS